MDTTQSIDQQIAARVAEYAQQDNAGSRAAHEPLPGPLVDVFAIPDSIECGPYKVRAFVDADFEFLTILKHPLHEMMTSQAEKAPTGNAKNIPPTVNMKYIPRGPSAWDLAWIMTRPAVETQKLLAEGGTAGLGAAARAEFSQYQIGAIFKLTEAVMTQMARYWSTVVGYGTKAKEGDENGSNPPQGQV